MTREEAKEMFRNDKDSYGKPKAIMSKIDKIFDEFEIEKGKIIKSFDITEEYLNINLKND